MGASCSSTALRRFNDIKIRLNQKPCMTFMAADGLLPRIEGQAPPIWLFGEDHGVNESDLIQRNKRNCAIVTDLVQHAVSSCGSGNNAAEVIVVIENGVIPNDAGVFRTQDINGEAIVRDHHHDVEFVRQVVKEQGRLYDNIRTVYMDVFGRIRFFHRETRRDVVGEPWELTQSYMINTIEAELREFWVTSGRYDEQSARIRSQALMGKCFPLAMDTMMHHFRQSQFIYAENYLETYIAVVCATLAKVLISSAIDRGLDLSLSRSYTRVIEDIDRQIKYISSEDYEIPPPLLQGVNDGNITIEDAREMMFDSEMFKLIVIAGDAVLFEYISSLTGSDKIVVMHAGYEHTNNQRKWLLRGNYDSDVERISDLAFEPGHYNFVATRN